MIKITNTNLVKYLELTENTKYVFSVKNYFIEKALKKYFDKMIIENFFTNDKIVNFFDKNDFGIKENDPTIIYKKDLIDENTIYGTIKNNKALQLKIANEFKTAFLEVLSEAEISFDIENYVMINVLIEEKDGLRIYTTTFQYYRNFIVDLFTIKFNKLMKKLIISGIILSIIIGIIILYFINN